jgi:pyruvate dehydrogenase E2 component (dihydrolipoamide acetyltransferase)
MAEKIIMPKTGMAMEEGVIIEWLIKEGDVVSQGDIVAEIETDKSTMELESDYDGTILKILYPAGSTVPVVKTIAWIGTPGEELPAEEGVAPAAPAAHKPEPAVATAPAANTASTVTAAKAEMVGDRVKATPAARRVAAEKGVSLAEVEPGGKHGEIRENDVLSVPSVSATPLAARIAADQKIPLSDVSGTGHGGKIFKSDLSALSGMSAAVDETFVPNYQDELVELTKIQKITGARMFQSHSEIPVVTENAKADVTELLEIRKSLNASLGSKLSINDFVMLATARMLRLNPRMNSSLAEGGKLLYKGRINLGMAVATPKGLLVPVIKDADMYSITGISAAAGELAAKGREGKLKMDEMEGGTFTVSNVGMFGVTSFTPIINQPEAGILGVCAVEDQLKMIDGEIVNRKIMGLSLTFDHRVVDGAEAAVAIKTLKDFLEAPLTILA